MVNPGFGLGRSNGRWIVRLPCPKCERALSVGSVENLDQDQKSEGAWSDLGTSIGPMTKLFVCYHAVTALTERFYQSAFASEEMAAGSRASHLQVQLATPTRAADFSTMGFGAPLALRGKKG